MEPKISIIVAVYNLEKYLPRCLDALVNQTLQEIEILCVDDGSTDSAPQIVDEYAKKGYFIFLVGKKDHPEIIGTKSFGGKNITIISDKSEIENAIKLLYNTNIKNLLIISQTTYSSKKFDELVEVLNEKISKDINITIKKTICPATEIRQKETEDIAKKVDMMIIIGDKKSSNTNKLYNISCKFCKKELFIQNKNELNINELENIEKVGIMAGASTPKEDIINIEKILRERNDIKHE